MAYDTVLVTTEEIMLLEDRYRQQALFASKADINGIIVELVTSDREHIDMWRDNLYTANERIRRHARIICVKDPEKELHVDLDPVTCTAVLYNFDYYGWVKSIALGLAGLILEAGHDTFSVHGAAVSVDDVGVTIIAPSKTGKTTQSWGLLRDPNSCLISDDWFFVTFGQGRPHIRGSEKNCYIDADIGDVWEEFKPLIGNVRFDNRGRGIANIRWVTGDQSVISSCSLRYVILLKRDPEDPEVVRELTPEQALGYLVEHDLCNPHQLVRDGFRSGIRRGFYRRLLENCGCYMVNTVLDARQTQQRIR